jgi:hypothetical protein
MPLRLSCTRSLSPKIAPTHARNGPLCELLGSALAFAGGHSVADSTNGQPSAISDDEIRNRRGLSVHYSRT